jgi:hypothetical protein
LKKPSIFDGFFLFQKNGYPDTAVPQIMPGDLDRKRIAEAVSRRDVDAEPPRLADIYAPAISAFPTSV